MKETLHFIHTKTLKPTLSDRRRKFHTERGEEKWV